MNICIVIIIHGFTADCKSAVKGNTRIFITFILLINFQIQFDFIEVDGLILLHLLRRP